MIKRPLTPENMRDITEATESGDFQKLMRTMLPIRDSDSAREWQKFDDALPDQFVSADILPWPCIVGVDEDTLAIAGYKPGDDTNEVTNFKGRHAALLKVTDPAVRESLMRGDAGERSHLLNKVIVIKAEGPFTGRGWIRSMADFCRRP